MIKAKIKELFKGEGETTVDFRSHMYAHLEVETLADLVGKDFLIFLHDPYKNKEYWLFQGPMGMRPIQENYSEWRLDDKGKPVTVTYTHEEYMRILRTELQQKKK
ncbi:MAG: hypothetical protein HYV35_06620 [Lentisphaerae bacterium]|nr:hypothetical protein [Lentisphaerota bacterium]